MTTREVQQKLGEFHGAIQTLFRKTLIGAEFADGVLFQKIHKLCFELCTLEQEDVTYGLIVNTLSSEVSQANSVLTFTQLRRYMNRTFREHVRHTSLVLNRLNVCHDLWRRIAVLSLDSFDFSWPIGAVLAACGYLNRFWLPQQRETRGRESALWGGDLIQSLIGPLALAKEETVPLTVNVDFVLGTEPPKRMQFDNVRSGLSQYFRQFVKYCGKHERLTINIKADQTLTPVLVQLMDYFKEPDKKIVIDMMDMSPMFELTLVGNYYGLDNVVAVASEAIANCIRGKNPEEIRERFRLK